MVKYYIYTLTCPIENTVRYVGCTVNPKSRLNAHIKYAQCDWRRMLKDRGLKPGIKIISIVTSLDEAIKEEKRVFNLFKNERFVSKDPNTYQYSDLKRSSHFHKYRAKDLSPFVVRNVNRLIELNKSSIKSIYRRLKEWDKKIKYDDFEAMIKGDALFDSDTVFHLHLIFSTDMKDLITEGSDLNHKVIKIKNNHFKEVNYLKKWHYKYYFKKIKEIS